MANIYLYLDGVQKGPYLPGQLRSMLAEGAITVETPAWREGLADWSSVAAMLAELPESSGPPPVPPSALPKPRVAARTDDSVVWMVIAGVFAVIFVLSCLAGAALGPITEGIKAAKQNVAMQQSRQIALAMIAYSVDHGGKFPNGSASTEVFQKLIDGKYVVDPGVFYVQMPGKVRAAGNTLTADNVSFDVTTGLSSASSKDVPLVYLTGFTMSYSSGSVASPEGPTVFPGIAVAYKGGQARFVQTMHGGSAVVSPPYDLNGETYRQLKP